MISYALLKKQSAETSAAIINYYKGDAAFERLGKYEGKLTSDRDKEDEEKLHKGIDFAKNKGVIDPMFVPEPYVEIDVLGKSPAQVSDLILARVRETESESSVIVLVGLSGTGKGTTVSTLRHKLESDGGERVVTWSNGNIFRSVTLLATLWCQIQGGADGFDADRALTKQNLEAFMRMLTFDKFNGRYDTRIQGLGLDVLVSEVQNTVLKQPVVAKNIPTVAERTQGEVILFASNAMERISKNGVFVLLEGREQTVNYVRTPHRFSLVLSDDSLIGKRRAAQRLMAGAFASMTEEVADVAVQASIDATLEQMTAAIDS